MNVRPILLAAAITAAITACSREGLSGPPELRLGRNECGECGMLISEDRCSSAILVERNGRREHVLFDDIGCMLAYEGAASERPRPIESFVHDYKSGAWVPAADAWFLLADPDTLSTPMASGIVAFAASDSAQAQQREMGGRVVDHGSLRDAARSHPAVPSAPHEGP